MSLKHAGGLIALVGVTTCTTTTVPTDRSATRVVPSSGRQATCPLPADVRAAFLRDSIRFAPGNVHAEASIYLTVFVNGAVWAANVHGSGVSGSFADAANMPSPDTLGEIMEVEWYPGNKVPSKYKVCPGVGAFVLVTKPKGGR